MIIENEIIKQAMRIVNENNDTLVAHFITENPNIPIERIVFIQDRSDPFKIIFRVGVLDE